MNWLLDTCVLSEYVSKSPAPGVIRWLDERDESRLFISVISLRELEKRILKLRPVESRRAQNLKIWFGKLENRFAERRLAIDRATMRAWAKLGAKAEASVCWEASVLAMFAKSAILRTWSPSR